MKNSWKFAVVLVFNSLGLNLHAQENCMGIKPEIAGKYTGKCKDGLANGNGITNLLMPTTSGPNTTLGESIGYENIIFPVTIKINYTTWNKTHAAQFYASFEFEIYETGDWVVDIHN